jgi:hypothetical protein
MEGVIVIDGKIRVWNDGKIGTTKAHGGEATMIFGSH